WRLTGCLLRRLGLGYRLLGGRRSLTTRARRSSAGFGRRFRTASRRSLRHGVTRPLWPFSFSARRDVLEVRFVFSVVLLAIVFVVFFFFFVVLFDRTHLFIGPVGATERPFATIG